MSEFGKAMLEEFPLRPDGIFLNHGSYGVAPKRVQEKRSKFLRDVESQPDVFFRRSRYQIYDDNIQTVAKFVGSKPENLVFVQNTTTGVNIVSKNISLKAGDAILINTWTYGPVKHIVDAMAAKTGAEVIQANLRVPIASRQQVIEEYRGQLERHSNIKYAIVDYISSVPPILMPMKEMVRLCKEYGVTVLVDGAHTPGQLPLDLESLAQEVKFDFFVGNLHKWGYAPRGCAILWVHPQYQKQVRPLVTSLAKEEFHLDFQYQGTDDFSTFYSAQAALQFYQDIGGMDKISAYNSGLVTKAADMLVEKWGTDLFPIPHDMEAPFMRMIRIPHLKKFPPVMEEEGNRSTVNGDIHELTMHLWDRFSIQALFLYVQSQPYVRISANVYNSMDDYDRLANAILTLVEEDKGQ